MTPLFAQRAGGWAAAPEPDQAAALFQNIHHIYHRFPRFLHVINNVEARRRKIDARTSYERFDEKLKPLTKVQ